MKRNIHELVIFTNIWANVLADVVLLRTMPFMEIWNKKIYSLKWMREICLYVYTKILNSLAHFHTRECEENAKLQIMEWEDKKSWIFNEPFGNLWMKWLHYDYLLIFKHFFIALCSTSKQKNFSHSSQLFNTWLHLKLNFAIILWINLQLFLNYSAIYVNGRIFCNY